MNYINKTVSIKGNEIEFLKALSTELHAADSRIVCETDIEAEFNKENSYKPIIVFNINDCYKINLKRTVSISTQAQYYQLTHTINGNESEAIVNIYFAPSLMSCFKVDSRCYKFSVIYGTNFLSINLTSYKYSLPLQCDFSMFSYHTDGFNIASSISKSSTFSTQSGLIRTDETGNGDIYAFSNRLNYSRGENMEFIESKVICREENAERTITDIIDCSSVTPGSIVNIDGSKYYALDSHTLALVEKSSVIEIN